VCMSVCVCVCVHERVCSVGEILGVTWRKYKMSTLHTWYFLSLPSGQSAKYFHIRECCTRTHGTALLQCVEQRHNKGEWPYW